MVLRVSAEATGQKDVDVKAVLGGEHADKSSIPYARELTDFAEAVCRRNPQEIAGARKALMEVAGPKVMVDAAGVAANFQRMNRLADSSGVPLEAFALIGSYAVRKELDVMEYHTASHSVGHSYTPIVRLLEPLLNPIMIKLMPLLLGKKKHKDATD